MEDKKYSEEDLKLALYFMISHYLEHLMKKEIIN
jgi:hypothetical protein